MPRHLTLSIPALATLAEQLRFAPVAAARRHVERAEALMEIIERDESYPEDFISFKITGFRPEIASPVLIPGEDLRRELPALIDRLCRGAKYTPADLPSPQWLNTEELASKWNVSRRTIERARREGLIGRRVNLGRGRIETRYDSAAIDRGPAPARTAVAVSQKFDSWRLYRRGNSGPRRVTTDQRTAILRDATAYARALGSSLTATCRAIATQHNRSPDTIRRVILSDDDVSSLFPQRSRLSTRQRKVVVRARKIGVKAAKLARVTGVSRVTIRRAELQVLVGQLRSVRLPISAELAEHVRRRAKLISEQRVSVLGGFGCPTEQFIAWEVNGARKVGPPDARIERALAEGYWFHVDQAQQATAQINAVRPEATLADVAVTHLRAATQYKVELVRQQWFVLDRTITAQLTQNNCAAREILEMTPSQAHDLIKRCIDAICTTIDRYDPVRGGRLTAPVGLELNRAVATWLDKNTVAFGPVEHANLYDYSRHVAPWQTFTDPPEPACYELVSLAASDKPMMIDRFGLIGVKPMTYAALATKYGTTPSAIARRERTILRRLQRKTSS